MRGPSRREVLRVGVAGLSRAGPRRLVPAARRGRGDQSRPATAKVEELHPDLAGRRAVAHRHVRPQARRPPADVRGEFKPIATSVPGLQISEVFPNLAKVMDRVTLIRSMTSPEADHDRASHHLLTGYRPSPALVYPGYGSVVSKVREAKRGMLPPYVAVPDAPIFSSSGYLTPGLRPVRRLGRSEPGGLPGPEPDAARPADAGAAAPPPRHGQDARRVRPRRPGDAADHQPRPVRRAGLLAADLERGPGGVPDRATSRPRSATSTAARRSASRACWRGG